MVRHTNNKKLLNQVSYGSMVGKIATSAVLDKVVSIDLMGFE